jgi:hypothetical protein
MVDFVITPYKCDGVWMFDDSGTGLVREPLIKGIDTMIEKVAKLKGVANPAAGVPVLFSKTYWSGAEYCLKWQREEDGGNWYKSDDLDMEGWLCPQLHRYFDKAPPELWVTVG